MMQAMNTEEIPNLIQRIYLKEAKIALGYHDDRTIRKWCINNDVGILIDYGSNRYYLLEEEFIESVNFQASRYLNEKETNNLKYKTVKKNLNDKNYIENDKLSHYENIYRSRLQKKISEL